MPTMEYTREVTLPSKGIFYEDAIPGGVLTIQSWSTKDQKLLAGSESIGDDMTNRLLKSGVMTEGVDLDKLLLTDRMFLLFHIRALSYGDLYRFSWKCSQCGTQVADEMDLRTDVGINWVEDGSSADEPAWEEPYDYAFRSGTTISLRYLRYSDQKAISAYTKTAFKNQKQKDGDPTYFYRIARRIVNIDGEKAKDIRTTMEWLASLRGPDSVDLLEALEYHEHGLELKLERPCSKCGWEEAMVLPFGSDFFHPGSGIIRKSRDADLG